MTPEAGQGPARYRVGCLFIGVRSVAILERSSVLGQLADAVLKSAKNVMGFCPTTIATDDSEWRGRGRIEGRS